MCGTNGWPLAMDMSSFFPHEPCIIPLILLLILFFLLELLLNLPLRLSCCQSTRRAHPLSRSLLRSISLSWFLFFLRIDMGIADDGVRKCFSVAREEAFHAASLANSVPPASALFSLFFDNPRSPTQDSIDLKF